MSDVSDEPVLEDSTPTEPVLVGSVLPPTPDKVDTGTEPRPGRVATSLLLVAALIGGLIGGAIVALADRDTGGTKISFGSNLNVRGKALDIQGILGKTIPAVVSIQTDGFVRSEGFFGPSIQRVRGAGTGMVISPDGEILTNNHVIEGAQRISVTFEGNQEAKEADLIGTDPSRDVAIIKLRNVSGLKTVTMGKSSELAVGDDVVAIGNALALVGGNTVTRGIVSALDRSVDDVENLDHLIQTDAAINSGNSGGPLVDASGEVVGMNTIVIRNSGSSAPVESIGFAISIDSIKPLIERLRTGKPAPGNPFVGINSVNLTPEIKNQLGVPVDEGAVVQSVVEGSPAENAGLRLGDVITSFNGKTVKSASELVSLVRDTKPGEKVAVVYYRGGNKQDTEITIGTRFVTN